VSDIFSNPFDTSGFPARWHCGTWSSELGWLHILSDIAIFGAYTAIPCVLAFFTIRRTDIPFPKVIWLFVSFIFACGTTHLIEAVIFWQPVYRFAGWVKLFTALVSWGTVVALVQIVPQVLHFPGLAKLNKELMTEVEVRKRIEGELRRSEERLGDLLGSERQARSDAERANRVKEEFLSTVSHELRTPLNAILGYAQLLLRSDDDAHEGLRIIERNAKAQAQLIDDLLDMSRIIAGKVRLTVAPVDLADVVAGALDALRPTADAKNIRLDAVVGPQGMLVLGDAARLQQVAWNLVSNAIKFTPRGGRVEVRLARADSHVAISVSDTGEGIAPEVLPLVFDRFQQADSSSTRRHGGLGLGLSIVKHLVELHGGSVRAASDGVGRGACFTVELPLRVVPADGGENGAPATSDVRLSADFTLQGARVLVVDDDPQSLAVIKQLLGEFDAEVETAGSVDEALAVFHQRPPDVLLSDIGMPGRDGYDLARAVRGLPESAGGKVPAAALTAFARSEDRKRALLAGYQAHITKPVDASELAIVVAALIGRTG
jgi:signal transduction histidine kinase/CheY-like chemotaxis protein